VRLSFLQRKKERGESAGEGRAANRQAGFWSLAAILTFSYFREKHGAGGKFLKIYVQRENPTRRGVEGVCPTDASILAILPIGSVSEKKSRPSEGGGKNYSASQPGPPKTHLLWGGEAATEEKAMYRKWKLPEEEEGEEN